MVAVTEQQEVQTGVEISGSGDESCKEQLNSIVTTTSLSMDSLKNKERTIVSYRETLQTHVEEGETLKKEIKKLTVQVQEIQDICTSFVPQDCCQVYIAKS